MVDRRTGGQAEAREAFAAQLAPSKRLSGPDQIAEVVVRLCSGESAYLFRRAGVDSARGAGECSTLK